MKSEIKMKKTNDRKKDIRRGQKGLKGYKGSMSSKSLVSQVGLEV